MNSKIFYSLFLIASISVQASPVKQLKNESVLEKDKVAVVKCYATWCGFCTKFAPIYENIAKQNSDKAVFYEVDAQTPQGKEFAGKYASKGFPTTVIFNYGKKASEVIGANESELKEKIEDAQTLHVEPISVQTSNSIVEDATSSAYLKQPGIVVVKFWASWCELCKPYAQLFEDVALENKDFAKFLQVDIDKYPTIQQEFKVDGLPRTLVLSDGKVVDTISGANDSRLRRTLKSLKTGTEIIQPKIVIENEKPVRVKKQVTKKRKSIKSRPNRKQKKYLETEEIEETLE